MRCASVVSVCGVVNEYPAPVPALVRARRITGTLSWLGTVLAIVALTRYSPEPVGGKDLKSEMSTLVNAVPLAFTNWNQVLLTLGSLPVPAFGAGNISTK